MKTFIVVNDPKDWPIHLPNVQVISSREYIATPIYENARIFNLCRSYRYQSKGYYVSLLAEARGHKTFPHVSALRDLHLSGISRIIAEDLEDLIQSSLKGVASNEFTLSVYFGKNLAKKYDRLSLRLFNLFRSPLLRATFIKEREWTLKKITPLSASGIPPTHQDFVVDQAIRYFKRPHRDRSRKKRFLYDLAILVDPNEATPPSDSTALKRFERAAEAVGFNPERITRDDYGRLGEFDALLIRATTAVNNYTYRFARRAETEGLAVIDDPQSIIRCTNKVFLHEALSRARIPTPQTWTVHEDNMADIKENIIYPCILKVPDSSFSQGVVKAATPAEFQKATDQFLKESDLILAQEFLPSDFDWRIGLLDGKPLYACQYFMAKSHWQILKKSGSGRFTAGQVKTVPISRVPPRVIRTAVRAGRVIGQGLYGVDLKDLSGRTVVIEVNDNPTIEGQFEDRLSRGKLYRSIMKSLLARVRSGRRRGAS